MLCLVAQLSLFGQSYSIKLVFEPLFSGKFQTDSVWQLSKPLQSINCDKISVVKGIASFLKGI